MATIEIVVAMCRVTGEIIRKRRIDKRNRSRKMWIRQWIQRRKELGASNSLLQELRVEDPKCFSNFPRIDDEMFETLLSKVASSIQKKDTIMRSALPAKLKLQIALRYLAAGDSLTSLQYLYRVPKCFTQRFFKLYMKVPNTEMEWKKIINGFEYTWNFPNCVGAIDGKHIVIQCPPNTGSQYFNYEGTFSIVLLALVDNDYNFICIDVGKYGSTSDGGVFAECALRKALEDNQLKLPRGSVVLGNEAFPVRTYLMKPYPRHNQLTISETIFNYRHCRARHIVENTFGQAASEFLDQP